MAGSKRRPAMSVRPELAAESEPPSIVTLGDSAFLVERVWAVAHLRPSAHVAIIGRHTFPVLEFPKRGCSAGCSCVPAPPRRIAEAADLTWIVDVGEVQLDEALRAARSRTGNAGRVIVEGRPRGSNPPPSATTLLPTAWTSSFDHLAPSRAGQQENVMERQHRQDARRRCRAASRPGTAWPADSTLRRLVRAPDRAWRQRAGAAAARRRSRPPHHGPTSPTAACR